MPTAKKTNTLRSQQPKNKTPCLACRDDHIKCEGGFPCKRCTKSADKCRACVPSKRARRARHQSSNGGVVSSVVVGQANHFQIIMEHPEESNSQDCLNSSAGTSGAAKTREEDVAAESQISMTEQDANPAVEEATSPHVAYRPETSTTNLDIYQQFDIEVFNYGDFGALTAMPGPDGNQESMDYGFRTTVLPQATGEYHFMNEPTYLPGFQSDGNSLA